MNHDSPPPHAAAGDKPGRLRLLFDAALEQPAHARMDWITTNVADSDQRAALLRLLEAGDAPSALDTPLAQRVERIGFDEEEVRAADLIGQRIGPFRLLRLLGQGGMATVFLGKREDADFSQQVAVKLLRRGLYSELEQRLFRRERRALAMLSHPNIAHLIDGGVTDAGIPYLVMEYIDGVPITQYAAEPRLDVDARLRLFLVVCRAVDAAHRQLIVHRDLKPSNILVSADGTVKLLDFGIAKLLDEDDDATRSRLTALTPDYAAPEQLAGGVISTATDVYALGVLLHELLLGVRPEAGATTKRPSACIVEARPGAHALPASQAALRGDLDNIVLKALASEPERRYASAGAFAEDIERHLDGRPVAAHPPSRWYRTQKFVQRHRGSVAMTIVFLLAILASLGLALWQARVARSEARRAGEVQAFVETLFEPLEKGTAPDKAPSIQELLHRGLERVDQSFQDDPRARAEVLSMFARINDGIGEVKQNFELSQAAYRANERAYGADDLRTLVARALHARVLRNLGQYDLALIEHKAVRATMEAQGVHGNDYARVLESLAATQEAGTSNAETLALKQQAVREREADPTSTKDDLASGYNNLGVALQDAHDFDQALHLHQRAYALSAASRGDSRATATYLANIGNTYSWMGRWHESAQALERARAMYRRIDINQHSNLMSLLTRLCTLRGQLESIEQARPVCDEAVAMAAGVHGDSHPNYGMALTRRAGAAIAAGRLDDAATDFQRARTIFTAAEGDPTRRFLVLNTAEAGLWRLRGDYARVRDLLRSVVASPDASDMPAAPHVFAWWALACQRAPGVGCNDAVTQAKRVVAAPAMARQPSQLPARMALAEIDLAHGDPRHAITQINQGLAVATAEIGDRHSWAGEAHLLLGDAHAALGDQPAAQSEYAKAAAVIGGLPPGHPLHGRIRQQVLRTR